MRRPALGLAALLAGAAALAEPASGGGKGTLYLNARPGRIVIADEATFRVTGEIPLPRTAPSPAYPLQLSQDRRRFLSYSANLEDVEVVDIAARKVVDTIRLSEGNRKVRFDGYEGGGESPRRLALSTRAATKLVDRFEIGPKTLVEYDLEQHRIGRTIPWPNGEEREAVGLRYSPDGKLLYLFADDVFVYDAETLAIVDKWEISRPLERGFGRIELGAADDSFEEPGFVTGLFSVDDPLQHRNVMGVARVDLAKHQMDFWSVGPAQKVRAFALAPGRARAYAILDEPGNYEFWTLDLVGRRLERRTRFPGRPRMDLAVSSDGALLYVYNAGNTIDIYDSATHRFVRTVTFDFEVSGVFVIPPGR